MQHNEEVGEGTSYEELARVDSIISDEMIYEAYSGINFTEDDFFLLRKAGRRVILLRLLLSNLKIRNYGKSKIRIISSCIC